MNREIKFRAWDGENMFLSGRCDLYALGGWLRAHSKVMAFKEKEKDSVLMQFTGLKDKKGNEIYEGDIVKRIAFQNQKIVFKNSQWCYEWEEKNGIFSQYINQYPIMHIEVIGNIYENPELLTI